MPAVCTCVHTKCAEAREGQKVSSMRCLLILLSWSSLSRTFGSSNRSSLVMGGRVSLSNPGRF